jgi:hypothetical protein
LNSDPELNELADQLNGRIGPEPSLDERKKLVDLARARIDQKVPPGFKDKKLGERDLGDAIVWLQTLEYAKAGARSVILVTDDGKEDWWDITRGRTIGPRPELVKEFNREVDRMFYMYQPSQFVKFAAERFKIAIDPDVIKEVKLVTSERVESGAVASSATGVTGGEPIGRDSIKLYLNTRFKGRKRATIGDAIRISQELKKAGYLTISDVEELVVSRWADFELYELRRLESGQSRFAQVGVVRIMINGTLDRGIA